MGTNLIIRAMEWGLFIGLILHVADGLWLYTLNRSARPVKYAYNDEGANSSWYSRSMAILGTLILIFLVVHLGNFWVKTRFTGIESFGVDAEGQENLFAVMQRVFQNPVLVVVYVLGCFSLFWHLLHGFKSAFQSLGLNHTKYNEAILITGVAFSIIVPIIFAMMPVSMFFGWVS